MTVPAMLAPQSLAPDLVCLPAILPVPDHGILPVNAFVIRGPEPVLVDTGLAALGPDFMAALETVIDPRDLRWIWLSHMDADHTGNLLQVLAGAPQARVVTNFLGMGKMNLLGLPLEAVLLLAPGAALDLPDRSLVPLRPPYYDAPESMGFFDTGSRALFCVDSFGALLPAMAETAAAIDVAVLRDGMAGWSAIDAPWLAAVDRRALGDALGDIRRLDPPMLLSAHLPPAFGMTDRLTAVVGDLYCSGPAMAPDRETFARLAAGLFQGVTPMTGPADTNRSLVLRFLDETHAGRLDVIDELVAEGIVTHGFPGGSSPASREEYRQFFTDFGTAFADMDYRSLAVVADAAMVAVRFRVIATHRGAFAGIPASGRHVDFTGMVFYRIADGRIAETWLQPDTASLLGQIGALAAAA